MPWPLHPARPVAVCECNDHAFATLTRGYVALVSTCDAHLLRGRRWRVSKSARGKDYRVIASQKGKKPYALALHREVLGRPDAIIDHVSGNTFDNRRVNLRACTSAENSRNRRSVRGSSSRFKGVKRNPPGKGLPFAANIHTAERVLHLGHFACEEEAARAYDAAAVRFFGEFARTNEMMGLFGHSKASQATSVSDNSDSGRGKTDRWTVNQRMFHP